MTASLELVPDDPDSELALARAASAGDGRAFERLYRRHSARVFALCLRMSGSRSRATELTQDVFVQVWRQLGTWRGESALATWIYRLTVNLVLGNARAETRRQRREMSADGEDVDRDDSRRAENAGNVGNAGSAGSAGGVVGAPAVGDAIDLERAIASLPDGARTVFVLHDVEGYRHGEIARMMGIAEGTCRAQLHRARRLLMEALER